MSFRLLPLIAVSVGVLCFSGSNAGGAAVLESENVPVVATAENEPTDAVQQLAEEPTNSLYVSDCYGDNYCCDPDCETYRRLDAFFDRCDWVCPSDECFNHFISPITNPFLFEDPRTLTEIKPTILHQATPASAGTGHINVLAMPIRVALTDRLSLILPKNGFIMPEADLDEEIRDGWVDTSLGLKYNLMKDYCQQRILTTGFTFEIPSGDTEAFQGNGDGTFNLFASYGAELGSSHWISGSGFVLPTNTSDESQIWWWSNHFDRQIWDRGCLSVYALGEVNWYHWMDSGEDGPLAGIEGNDLFNLGSPGVAGNDIVTGAFGTKVKPYGNAMEVGVAWETHLTDRRDLLEDRLTVDWILRF
jgi:hypothetical protein